MNKKEQSETTSETLAALRGKEDAVRLIAERLGVKVMGPADHIRTKHEVKAFVESGDVNVAEALLRNAQARRELNQSVTEKLTQQRGVRVDR